MHSRLQFTIPECEAETIFSDIRIIAPYDKAIVATTDAPNRANSKLLIVLTSDLDIEMMLRLKYAGCETHIMRYK